MAPDEVDISLWGDIVQKEMVEALFRAKKKEEKKVKAINMEKLKEIMNDDLIVELMMIIKDMKNPPKHLRGIPEVEDVVAMGNRLDRQIKNTIFEAATIEVAV